MSSTTVSDIVSTTIDNKPEPTDEELDTFKVFVNDWFKYDDQMRKLQIALKERKNYQKTLGQKIQNFMIKYEYNDLNTQHGRIRSTVRETKAPVKLKDVKDQLVNNPSMTGQELYDIIFNSEREKTVKKRITRQLPRVSMALEL